MNLNKKQGELFRNDAFWERSPNDIDLKIRKETLELWQQKISTYQSPLFKNTPPSHVQNSLFPDFNAPKNNLISPLELTALPLSFWRWPESPHHGPAIYLVMDKSEASSQHLMLYIGETVAANKRWRGEHDCKEYLASYSEALIEANLNPSLSIRFWTDVPKDTKARRQIEQELIQKWLPPFNKETRTRWSTPFTSLIE